MPVVTVNLPEAKSDPLLKQLSSQFERLQKELMGLKKSQGQDTLKPILTMMGKQQDALLKAMERMGHGSSEKADSAMLDALKGLKKAMAGLPDALSSAMDGNFKQVQHQMTKQPRPQVTVHPEVKVNLGGLNKTMNRIEEALVSSGKRGRNRTFGSNY
jgi:hypothetical protein